MIRSRREIVLGTLLSRCSEKKRKELERFLPEEVSLQLRSIPPGSEKETPKDSLFDQIHWSWFLPILKTYSKEDQSYFLAALPSQVAEPLGKQLGRVPASIELTRAARSYLQHILEQSVAANEENLLPTAYLPASRLSALLHIEKKDLIHLIQLLALRDLSHELRHIVETKTLKKIYSFLTEEEKKRLKELSSLPKSGASSPLFLDRWSGNEEAFRVLLHKKGLARLSLALRGQDPDLIWYVCHQLDIGRGSSLFKLCSKEEAAEISEEMIHEIEELIQRYL